MAREHDFAIRGATEQAVRSEVLAVIGIDGFPAELLFEVLGCGLLNEGVFGVRGWVHFATLALTLALTLACHRGRILAAIQKGFIRLCRGLPLLFILLILSSCPS